MNTYEHLFTPIKIGNTTVKNRIFMPPLSTNLADKGYVTDALVKHYAARAKGGVGLIVTEVTTVEPTYTYLPGDMSIYDDSYIPGWKKLVDAVHQYDTKILSQLFHPAYMAFPIPGTPQLIAPSNVGPYYAKSAPREVTKEELREIIEMSLELRRRVKEQLKKIGGMEFYDVNFSYIDNDSFEEHYVSVPEQGGGKLIPEGAGKPGSVYTISKSKTGMIGCYMLETQIMPGNGKLTCTGIGAGKEPKEATNTAFNYLKANKNRISGQISTTTKDYIINYQEMQGIGMTGNLALPTLIAICSAALGKTPLNSLAILGEISIGGTLIKVDELASTLQVCLDSGAKKVLLPITSAGDLSKVPSDLIGAFSLIFYSSVEEAVFKALGVE